MHAEEQSVEAYHTGHACGIYTTIKQENIFIAKCTQPNVHITT